MTAKIEQGRKAGYLQLFRLYAVALIPLRQKKSKTKAIRVGRDAGGFPAPRRGLVFHFPVGVGSVLVVLLY